MRANAGRTRTPKQKTQTPKFRRLTASPPKNPVLAKLTANRKVRVVSIFSVLIVLIVALGWWGWSNSSLSRLSATTVVVKGTLEYRLADDDPWERAREGMSFGEGAQLRTGDDSRANIRIANGSEIRMNSSTTIVLVKLARQRILVEDSSGDVYARVAGKSKHTFYIRAGKVEYRSTNAAYRVLQTTEKSGTEVYYGQISVLQPGMPTTNVGQGERLYLKDSTATDLEGKVATLAHADLAADSFIVWNSEQDRKRFEDKLGALFDLTAPEIEIIKPTSGTITDAGTIEVTGRVEKGAVVLVNDRSVTNNNGRFSTLVTLNEGENTVVVGASDPAGNASTQRLTITRQSLAPEENSTHQ